MSAEILSYCAMVAAVVTALTTVCYTVATFFICRANIKSAKSADEQAKAMQAQSEELLRQYQESNRARLSIRFGYDDAVGKYFILKNVGRADAENVHLTMNEDFVKELDAVFPNNRLRILSQSLLHIAGGQEFPVLVAFESAMKKMRVKSLVITARYDDDLGTHENHAMIDFSQYEFLCVCTTTTVENGARVTKTLDVKG